MASPSEAEARLDPAVRAWVTRALGTLTPAQLALATEVADGEHALLAAPTGSGKTLAALLPVFSRLVSEGRHSHHQPTGTADATTSPPGGVRVLYVSPLRALNNDVARNVVPPLAGFDASLAEEGAEPHGIRVGVRTGDTPASERRRHLRDPPHILVTTPESLALLLVSPRFRDHLERVDVVIVDEVHAFIESKRGAHLALALERLSALVTASGRRDPQRIGLSATVHPIEEAASFLFGDRDGVAASLAMEKRLDLDITLSVPEMPASSRVLREATLATVEGLVASHESTLVFANTRYGTEDLVQALGERRSEAGVVEDAGIGAHHGSLSRETRLGVESALKEGRLRGVVTSASLELGIDIGALDLVIQLGSPKGAARLLQRAGRAGHRPGAAAKARILPTDREDLVESVVLAKRAREGRLEPIAGSVAPLDVLAQHLLGYALERGIADLDEAFAITRRAHPYRELSRDTYLAVVRYLAGQRRDASEGWNPRIRLDESVRAFAPRGRLVRAAYCLNQGAIPSEGRVRVLHGDTFVGDVDEDFASLLDPGEILVLAGSTWRVVDASSGSVRVDPARGRQPTVPRWRGERLGLPADAAREVAALRARIGQCIAEGLTGEGLARLVSKHYDVSPEVARAVVDYHEDQARLDALAKGDEVLVEEFLDDEGMRLYAFHAVLGRRANDALARAVARRVQGLIPSGQRGPKGVGTLVSDTAFALRVPRGVRLRVRDLRDALLLDVAREARESLRGSALESRRFRHVSERALLVLKHDPLFFSSPNPSRRSARPEILLEALRSTEPDHIVLEELDRELLDNALDIETAARFLGDVAAGRLRLRLLKSPCPSPFAHHLLAQGLEDSVDSDDRNDLLRDLHERVRLVLKSEAAG